MLYISGTHIQLTRGDTAYLTVEITNQDGTAYELQPDDVLTLSVKRYVSDPRYAFQKTVNGLSEIKILPEDTAGLDFGEYKYDVQLSKANGDIHTVIPVSTFEVLKEVTL